MKVPGTPVSPTIEKAPAPMGVEDRRLHTAQPTLLERPQEVRPESLGFGGHNRDTEDLAVAVRVGRADLHHRHRADPPALAQLHVGGIQPEEGPVAL